MALVGVPWIKLALVPEPDLSRTGDYGGYARDIYLLHLGQLYGVHCFLVMGWLNFIDMEGFLGFLRLDILISKIVGVELFR